MAVMTGRVVLAVCAVLAMVGGAALTVMAIVYFAGDQYLDQLNDGGDGILAGLVGLLVYVAGAFRAHIAARIAAGIGAAIGALIATSVISFVLSLAADRGGPQGNLQDGISGAIWLLVGGFFVWRLITRRWPVAQQHPDLTTRGGSPVAPGRRG
ncbi:MAG: hypothetical protein WCA46_28315 [Actinocatenispora sp.]